ncbi:hypothetical protein Z946_1756 [Sulfitobacter noctilucicola]|nr:hypothetical protein Z946_1756 [Sulfitobacter noctilucicola]
MLAAVHLCSFARSEAAKPPATAVNKQARFDSLKTSILVIILAY